jgi:hypothetical protein
MSRLPTPGSDDDVWGQILNDFLAAAHNPDGSLQASAVQQAGGITSVNGKSSNSGTITLSASDLNAPTALAMDNDVSIVSPIDNQVLTYNSTTSKWVNQTSSSGVQLDTTSSDIQSLGTQSAGATGKAADAGHVHAMPRLDQLSGPTASVSLNSQKITNLSNGSGATDAAAFGQIPTAGTGSGNYAVGNDSRITGAVQVSTVTTKGDLLTATASSTITRLGVGSDGQLLTADSTQATGLKWSSQSSSASDINNLYVLSFMDVAS